MNTQSGAMESTPVNLTTSATIPVTQLFVASVRRELWEYRSLYLAPLIIIGLYVVAFVIGAGHAPHHGFVVSMNGSMSTSEMPQEMPQGSDGAHALAPYTFAAYVLMGISLIVGVFYCLDALYGERRDRSILFWKSLPVSDLVTVLAKASIPIVLLPLYTAVLSVVAQWIMLLLDSIITMARGGSVAALWANVPLFQMSLMMFFHMLAIHGLQFAPVYCWLLLVSAWARRTPLLWALLPPIVILVAEKIAFNTHYFGGFLQFMLGGAETVPFTQGRMQMAPLTAGDLARFLTYPGLWVALVVSALLLALTIRVRRSRDPI